MSGSSGKSDASKKGDKKGKQDGQGGDGGESGESEQDGQEGEQSGSGSGSGEKSDKKDGKSGQGGESGEEGSEQDGKDGKGSSGSSKSDKGNKGEDSGSEGGSEGGSEKGDKGDGKSGSGSGEGGEDGESDSESKGKGTSGDKSEDGDANGEGESDGDAKEGKGKHDASQDGSGEGSGSSGSKTEGEGKAPDYDGNGDADHDKGGQSYKNGSKTSDAHGQGLNEGGSGNEYDSYGVKDDGVLDGNSRGGGKHADDGKECSEGENKNGYDDSYQPNAENFNFKRPKPTSDRKYEVKTLEQDFTEHADLKTDAIREEMKKLLQAAENTYHSYRAYTDEDEVLPAKENKSSYETAYESIRGITGILSSYLEQSLKTLSRTRSIYNHDKGMLNVHKNAAVISKSLSKNIFEKKIKGISLDTSVSILIDESGSIGSDVAMEFQKIVIAFSEVLERLGIKFEVLGHTGFETENLNPHDSYKFTRQGTKLVIFEHKAFNRPYNAERYRLGSIGSFHANIDGEALLETFKRCVEQKTERHIIFVFSDGVPCADYERNRHEIINLQGENLRDTIKMCRDCGVEVYGFGIGTNAPAKFYGNDNFIYLSSVDKLTASFFQTTARVITTGRMK